MVGRKKFPQGECDPVIALLLVLGVGCCELELARLKNRPEALVD